MKVKMKLNFSKASLTSKNFWAGLIGCVFSVLVMMFNKNPSSAYPMIVSLLSLVFSLMVLFECLMGKNDRCSGFGWQEIILMAVLVINPALGKYFGFYFTAFIEVLVILLFINKDRSKKGVITSIVFSIILVAVSYLIFTYGLRIRCPKGKIISLL